MSPAIAALLADIADETLADELRKRDWICTKVDAFGWETPKAFCLRHGFHKDWLSHALSRNAFVPDFFADKGKHERINRLRSNAQLEAFMQERRKQYHETTP